MATKDGGLDSLTLLAAQVALQQLSDEPLNEKELYTPLQSRAEDPADRMGSPVNAWTDEDSDWQQPPFKRALQSPDSSSCSLPNSTVYRPMPSPSFPRESIPFGAQQKPSAHNSAPGSRGVRTLHVVGFPSDVQRREIAHIFRPFIGYRNLRMKVFDDRSPIAFVEFETQENAATAKDALQGYIFDELQPEILLNITFARRDWVYSRSHGPIPHPDPN